MNRWFRQRRLRVLYHQVAFTYAQHRVKRFVLVRNFDAFLVRKLFGKFRLHKK